MPWSTSCVLGCWGTGY